MKKSLLTTVALALSLTLGAQTDSIALDEIVVTGSRVAADARLLPMTVTVIGRDVLASSHSSSVLPVVMEQVPALTVTSRAVMGYGVSTGAAGGINMRGISGGAGQLLVLIDGMPQYNGIFGHPISDSYMTMMTERVEVLRGPASVLYGSNAMGGVINIVTRGMATDGVKTDLNVGAGSYGTFNAEATLAARHGGFSATASAHYGRSDNHRPRMGFEQYGGYASVGYDLSAYWKTRLVADVTHFNASYPGSTSASLYDADQYITRGVVSAAVENHYEHIGGAFTVFSNFGRHKIDDGTTDTAQPTQRYFRSKDALTGVSLYQTVHASTTTDVTAGVDFVHIYGNAYYTSKATGEVIDTPNKQSGRSYRNEVAVYAKARQGVCKWLSVDAGLRMDHHSITGTEWIPQAGLVVAPRDNGEVKLSVSKGFRNPTMREMYLYPPSNEQLEPERIMNYELSWHHRPGKLRYGVNLFYLNGDNMIQTVERKNVNTGKIENCGMECDARYRINNHWTLTTNHAFLHMEHPVIAAPQYKGFVGAQFDSRRWHVRSGLQVIAGLFTAVGENETKENFCLLNIAADYAVAKSVTLWLTGDNLLAQRYEYNSGYPMPRATFMAGVKLSF